MHDLMGEGGMRVGVAVLLPSFAGEVSPPALSEVEGSYGDGGVMSRAGLGLMTPPPPITGAPPQLRQGGK